MVALYIAGLEIPELGKALANQSTVFILPFFFSVRPSPTATLAGELWGTFATQDRRFRLSVARAGR
jgi:hypothetical protein